MVPTFPALGANPLGDAAGQEALLLKEGHYGPNHLEVATTVSNPGNALGFLGNRTGAGVWIGALVVGFCLLFSFQASLSPGSPYRLGLVGLGVGAAIGFGCGPAWAKVSWSVRKKFNLAPLCPVCGAIQHVSDPEDCTEDCYPPPVD
jgi:hypothetical protein